MTRPVMFLRTAQTESRIEELEQQMAKVLKHLKLDEPEPLVSDDEWEKAAPPIEERTRVKGRFVKKG